MHMVAVCRALRIAPITFVHPARRLEAIRSAYSMQYAHVDSTDLELSEHLDPPAAKTQRGRKQKKRMERSPRKGGGAVRRCGHCGNEGHDKRKCPWP